MKKLYPYIIFVLLASCNNIDKEKEPDIDMSKVGVFDTSTYEVLTYEKLWCSINDSIITRSDYIQFLNEILNPYSLIFNEEITVYPFDCTPENNRFEYEDLLKYTDSNVDTTKPKILNKKDIAFICEQAKAGQDSSVSAKYINRRKITRSEIDSLSADTSKYFWNELYKFGEGYYNKIWLPLFSIDKSVAIVSYSYSCGGLCGHSGTYIYKKENGKWIYVGHIGMHIVS